MRLPASSVIVFSIVVGACSAGTSETDLFDGSGGQGQSPGETSDTTTSVATTVAESTASGFLTNTANTVTSGGIICDSLPTDDEDMDGFTGEEGDCNDCDANVNPRAIEVIVTEPDAMGNVPQPADEDCDGQVDNVLPPCDMGIPLAGTSGLDAAKAIDICKAASGPDDWGLVNTQVVRATGDATSANEQMGVMSAFGAVMPRKGASLLVMSSGNARTPGQPDACDSESCAHGMGVAPAGYPSPVPDCAGASNIEDDIGLQITVRAPSNATGYKFDFKFHSFEFPEYVCTDYNDQFFVMATPPPMGAAPNGNITFDANNNPVSVNVAFFDVCDPSDIGSFAFLCDPSLSNCPAPPNPFCPLGAAELLGTGFELDAGATSWLQTQAPIDPGSEVTLRLAIFDTGDSALDSTVLVDNFAWIANGGTVAVGTNPVPD